MKLLLFIAIMLLFSFSHEIKNKSQKSHEYIDARSYIEIAVLYVDGLSYIALSLPDSTITIRGDTTAVLKIIFNLLSTPVVLIQGKDTIRVQPCNSKYLASTDTTSEFFHFTGRQERNIVYLSSK